MALLDLDARWRRFNDPDRISNATGQPFSGVFDIGFDHPSPWPHAERGDAPFAKEGEDQLTADLCRCGDQRFVRAVISLPIQGSDDEHLHISPWVALPADRFYAYLDSFDGSSDAPLPDTPATLANQLPSFETETEDAAPVLLHFPGPEARPIAIAQGDSALALAQENGISFDQLLDIYAAFGQDIRPDLMHD
jgi:hypothetical protein